MAKYKIYGEKALIVIILSAFLFSSLVYVIPTDTASANASSGSDVIVDLQKDADFKVYDYPIDTNDNSIKLIQVAESTNKELLVYVYQPSCTRVATSINLSSEINGDLDYNNYKLQLINKKGPLQKYKVLGFTVKDDNCRYYSISSIFRDYDEQIDGNNDNLITEKAFEVAKQFSISEVDGVTIYQVLEIEVITITDKFVGFVEYSNGFHLVNSTCQSHFIAFNTDKKIDNLIEADVYYTSQPYSYRTEVTEGIGGGYHKYENYGEKNESVAKLKYTDKVDHKGGGLFAAKYSWNRIETVENFIKNENITTDVYTGAFVDVNYASNITTEGIENLKGKQWILRFVETPYEYVYANNQSSLQSVLINNETILRLKFETNGKVYNLGVIDNKNNPKTTPINDENISYQKSERYKDIFKTVILVLIILLGLAVISPLLPYIFKFVAWSMSLPYKAILKYKELKERKEDQEEDEITKNEDKHQNNTN